MKKWYEGMSRGDHAAHLYHSPGEQNRVIIDVLNWMDENARLILLSDRWEGDPNPSRSRLLDAAMEDGQFMVIPAKASLFLSGRFRAEALKDIINQELQRALSEGCTSIVAMWDLDWQGEDPDDFEAHIVQQSTLPISGLPANLTMIGQYCVADLTPQQVERVMRVNQLVLEDGELTRQFWLVANSTMGRPPRDRGGMTMMWISEGTQIDDL